MSNQYEALVQAMLSQAAQDQRAQPWKHSVNTQAPISQEEWVEVNPSPTSENPKPDVRTNVFPIGDVDVRANAFPIGSIDVRSNAFPMGEVKVLTNAFPVGDVNVLTNAFPI
ncbi:hypothetical protein HD806DRAFT_511225 [Xylariaceae sp. AK1471]|nr:hypothetical protein HD806DRAFT_511225 [Xylariaceae sp. AK1471]